jgi:hypothetical protein
LSLGRYWLSNGRHTVFVQINLFVMWDLEEVLGRPEIAAAISDLEARGARTTEQATLLEIAVDPEISQKTWEAMHRLGVDRRMIYPDDYDDQGTIDYLSRALIEIIRDGHLRRN